MVTASDTSNVFRPDSWEALQQVLFTDSWDSKISRFRSSYIYRGQNDVNQRLTTSLIRLGGDYAKLERHLIRNFIKYAHRDTKQGDSLWNWLALAQHHGLPTRLLDWTYSPYVALHFATNEVENFHSDGVIWATNYVKLNERLPEKLKRIIKEEESNTFTAEMLQNVCINLTDLANIQQSEAFMIFLEPPSLDNRIVNQFALFSLISDPTLAPDTYLQDHKETTFKIIIPKELKWEIRDKLDQANITERVLFPGLDGLSDWLKRHYTPSLKMQQTAVSEKHMKIQVFGKVQGVYFRKSTQEKAQSLGLTGWVANQNDGSVLMHVSGSVVCCNQFMEWVQQGPQKAEVSEVRIQPQVPTIFEDFLIR
ncbi:MAG: FRG domain-containing protein [Schleiferiaceae bacterium]|nr:FRG domain-containing protein [Schleiferiaceae bacterium]